MTLVLSLHILDIYNIQNGSGLDQNKSGPNPIFQIDKVFSIIYSYLVFQNTF